MRFGFFDHAVDVVLAHAAVGLDRDLLLLAGAEILRRNVHDAVGVDVELDLDAGHSARRGRDVRKLKPAQRLVASRHFALALQNVNVDRRLIVRRRGEHLALGRRNRRVALDDLRADAAQRFNAERQRRNVKQQHVLDLADEDAALNRRADGDALVRVHAVARLFCQILLDGFLHRRDTGRTADENDFVDVGRGKLRVCHRLARRLHRRLHEVVRQLIELRARQRQIEVQRTVRTRRDERKIDICREHAGKFDFRLLCGFHEALGAHLVRRKVDAVVLLELGNHPVDDAMVEIVAAEMGVAVGRLDLENAVAQLEDRHIESAAAEVEDEDRLVVVLVKAIGQRRRRRLVDDAEHVETRDLAGVFRSLPLAVVEISRNGDDGLGDRLAEICFRVGFQLLQHHRGNFRRRVALVVNRYLVILLAHVTLDGSDGAVRVRNGLSFRQLADEPLAVLREADYRRRQAAAFRVRDDGGLAALHNGNDGIRRT